MTLTDTDWRRAREAYNILDTSDHDSLGPVSAGRMVAEYDRMTPEERVAMYRALEILISGGGQPAA